MTLRQLLLSPTFYFIGTSHSLVHFLSHSLSIVLSIANAVIKQKMKLSVRTRWHSLSVVVAVVKVAALCPVYYCAASNPSHSISFSSTVPHLWRLLRLCVPSSRASWAHQEKERVRKAQGKNKRTGRSCDKWFRPKRERKSLWLCSTCLGIFYM